MKKNNKQNNNNNNNVFKIIYTVYIYYLLKWQKTPRKFSSISVVTFVTKLKSENN